MRLSRTKILAVPVTLAALAAGVAIAAPSARADAALNDTSGTVAITLPASFVAQLAKAGIVEYPTPLSELSASSTNKTVTVTFNVTGGNADVSIFYGALNLSGSLHFANANGKQVSLGSLLLDVANADFAATPAGSTTSVPLLDLTDNTSTFTGTGPDYSDTYDSSDLVVDPAGAAYLNSALHTSAFQAGEQVGTLSSSWDLTYND